jgi:DNA-binding transcriptional LysR family regulator
MLLFKETLVPVAAPGVAAQLGELGKAARWRSVKPIYARSRFLDWSVWQRHAGDVGVKPEGGVVVETRAQALDAALAGAGVAIIDAAYIPRHVAEGRLLPLAREPVQLAEGYYFVQGVAVRNERALYALRDWLSDMASAGAEDSRANK